MAIVPIYNEMVLLETPPSSLRYWEHAASPSLASMGYTISNKYGATLHYNKRITPAWTIVLAIVLFPVGLLALISKRDVSLIVSFEAYGDGTMVKISGNGPKRTKKWLDEMTDLMNNAAWADSEAADDYLDRP